MNRRHALRGLAGTALAPAAFVGAADRAARPNILFVMADDLGYADLSCYGRRDYRTPVLDHLATQGMRLTSAYSNSPVCSATRTALITGRYQYHFPVGLEEPLVERDVGLDPAVATLPSVLQAAGYTTALAGKWHLGKLPKFGPLQSGYQHFWGFRGGGIGYFTHLDVQKKADLWDGDVPVDATGYLTTLLADRTIELLKGFARKSSPFFLSLHLSAPHWPWEGPDDVAEAERVLKNPRERSLVHFDGGSLRAYAEMVTSMDREIGRVLTALEKLGLMDNTIVVFTSDNGGERFSDMWPFSGRKFDLLEGGIRVPAIMRWPGRIRGGTVGDTPIMSMDWMPTLLAAAGVPAPGPLDGVDVGRALLGEPLPERTLFWRYKRLGQQAARRGRFKYLRIAGNSFMFDLEADPLERANLRDREPERFAALTRQYDQWNATLLPLDDQSRSAGFSSDQMADRPAAP
jgi:arylsulfatase A-like enzyme